MGAPPNPAVLWYSYRLPDQIDCGERANAPNPHPLIQVMFEEWDEHEQNIHSR